ncbi:efflux RND transporter periplasmic adaptor subunit [Rhodoferax sp. PAMC 29310]|uniref:efflux RND transporter periplasmic adaptor subunit n=1 Tax=Rhodoferax sp. PAMC 29310 TaxID=2822760 RepID=UPI001B33EA98|nr:efflux RND transporter periplasmic adaptor subunit [Rhodoferax sp. PAMC 29310]
MNAKTLTLSLVAAGVLSAAGYGLYRMGMQQGMQHTASPSDAMPATAPSAAPAVAMVDPSTWGIPQGEAATRRHMETGIKAGQVDPETGREVLYYHDPMTPGKKFDAPGKSPFMDMMLVPAYAGSAGADSGTISVSPRIQQNLGLRTGDVTQGALGAEVLAAGAIAWNERDLALVQARAMGYVEKVHVGATLDRVSKGQALFEVYVPDWVAAQEDYLSVRRMQGQGLAPLLDAARQRMRQSGMSEAQIALVERSGVVQARLTLTAPIAGVLTELNAREGSTVMPGMLLARINGLSSVWAEAQVPESQAAQMRVGAKVVARSAALPGTTFEGKVQALLPEVNASTRTFKVRMVLRNPGGQLVPGMFVQMALSGAGQANTLFVPSEAVIRTGQRVVVMVAEADGAFRPVEVETGLETAGKTEIRRGLQAGQKVVLSGQFLIDSEASLKGIEARTGPKVEAAKPSLHVTRALIEAVNGSVLTLTHPEIDSLKWPGMTMGFQLAPSLKALPKSAIKVGSEVDIEFSMGDDGPQIESLRAASGKAGAP